MPWNRVGRWLAGAAALIGVAAVGGPFVYTHYIEPAAPARLGLSSGSAPTTGGGVVALDGRWTVAGGSQAGYRVKEVLFGQRHEAVGRTSSVTGSFEVHGSAVTAGTFTVDLSQVTSDEARRDSQFRGRIMDTASYRTATFSTTQPIQLNSIPPVGAERPIDATGLLTMHGVARAVTAHLTVRYTGGAVDASGWIPVTFADWNIPNPSFGQLVTTEDHGVVEFVLHFSHV